MSQNCLERGPLRDATHCSFVHVKGHGPAPHVFMDHRSVPGLVLSVRLSESLVKAMDDGLSSGNFPRPAWLSVKTVLVINWLVRLLSTETWRGLRSLLYFLLRKTKGHVKRLSEKSLAEGQGPSLCPSAAVREPCSQGQLTPSQTRHATGTRGGRALVQLPHHCGGAAAFP